MPDKREPTLYEALMKAQQAFGPVLKNATNPHLKSKYADLGAVIETITGPLNDNGLLFFQTIQPGGEVPELVTAIVLVATGDKIESHAPLISKDPTNPQAFGAAVTYMRRYSLLAMCGLSPEDDDGHAATQHVTARATSPRSTAPQHDAEGATQPANVRAELTDKEFDAKVRRALEMIGNDETKEAGKAMYQEAVEDAGSFVGRWMVLIHQCESLQSLDWVAKQIERKGIQSPGLPVAIRKRRGEIENRPVDPWFDTTTGKG